MKSELNIGLLILETLSLMQIVFIFQFKLYHKFENKGLLEYIDF